MFTPPEAEAERILLDLADYVYANTALKPMSKTLFAISRLLFVVAKSESAPAHEPAAIARAYKAALTTLVTPLHDDFLLEEVVEQCGSALPKILRDLHTVARLANGNDALGLLFDTLVRGKWDAGEGLGTFLTPEPVVHAIVEMVLTRNRSIEASPERLYVGDICGGTGRFAFAIARALLMRGMNRELLEQGVFSLDQSALATDYARLNLHFLGLHARCHVVADSLVAEEASALRGMCSALATNPPFGASKYEVSPALRKQIEPKVLRHLTNDRHGCAVDPAALFLVRNLDLLCVGGVLGIVLPDGLVQSPHLIGALHEYEDLSGTGIEVRALVSLPPVTFAFGGTVAKTSFLILSKEAERSDAPLFAADAAHIGFLKRANKKIADPKGNDLERFVTLYEKGDLTLQQHWRPNWREWARLGLQHRRPTEGTGPRLHELAKRLRDSTTVDPESETDLHISVLDVDDTGLINILASASNRPSSRVLSCQPGDVLISCINPRIWRVAVVPSLPGRWSCSPEFLVLRPQNGLSPWELALRLHHADFQARVLSMAGGTSSSRQRVDKDQMMSLSVPVIDAPAAAIVRHKTNRESFYALRLEEGRMYKALHNGHALAARRA